MCGIAGIHVLPEYKGLLPVGQMVDELLLGIENRGTDATGLVCVGFNGKAELDKEPMPAKAFIKARKKFTTHPQTVLGHTRLATQGDKRFSENNHPVLFGTVMVTHNGVIYNDAELFAQYDIERPAAVDTVAIPAMLYEVGFDRADEALEMLEGSMAIAAIDVLEPGKLILARGSYSPLVVLITDKFIVWASTMQAIKGMWTKCFGTPPADNRFLTLKEGTLMEVTNGAVEWSSFVPKEVVYSYGYSAALAKSQGWGTDDYRYGTESNRTSLSKYDASGRGGYWVADGGTRKYVEYGGAKNAYQPAATDLVAPGAKDLDVCDTYNDWTDIDVEINEATIEALAEELELTVSTTKWVMFYGDPAVIDSVPSLSLVRDYLNARYNEVYEELLGRYYNVDEPTGASKPEDEGECLFCGDMFTVRGDAVHCDQCTGFRNEMASDAFETSALLRAASEAGTEAELTKLIAERSVPRAQLIAEATRVQEVGV